MRSQFVGLNIHFFSSFCSDQIFFLLFRICHLFAPLLNHKYFKYDHVEQGKRQVGSTFKPFVYATAINQLGLSPCEKFSNTPYTIPKGRFGIPKAWTPKNSGEKYGGEISLK